MKTCKLCKVDKEDTCFCKHSKSKDGLNAICRDCAKIKFSEYARSNKDKLKAYRNKYNEDNKDKLREKRRLRNIENRERNRARCKAYYATNKTKENERKKRYYEEHRGELNEKAKLWRSKNRDRLKLARKAYYLNNRKKEISIGIIYRRERKKRDGLFAAKCRLSTLIATSIKNKGFKKPTKSEAILGCSVVELLAMWGVSCIPSGLEIDHIVPMAQARTEEEAIKLCHHTNLRLMPKEENYIKRANQTEEGLKLIVTLLGREWEFKNTVKKEERVCL